MDEALRARFESKYALWKERLLDLSGRNRLLNFRPTKVSTIGFTSPDVETLFRRLVIDESSLKFPLYQGRIRLHLTDEEEAAEVPPDEEQYRVRPGDIETAKAPPDLEKSLYRLTQLGRASREERGVNTLYVALGMLEWRPIDEADWQKAPLLLIPVDLSREDHLHPYILRPLDEDAEFNPTLVYMLRNDFDFAAPDFPEEVQADSLGTFVSRLETAVKAMGWKVNLEAWLGQFQFKKLAMYNDLEEHQLVAADNRLLGGVAGIAQFEQGIDVGDPHTFDEIRPSEMFTALDADRSQIEALLRVRGGQDVVIQGPPGTGKSQTITNLIIQSLFDGKKVLFVSEKMAALSVVHRRLEETGLAPYCLELHSDKANKRDVLARISRAANAGRQSRAPDATAHLQFDTLLSLRRELNNYVSALHTPVSFGKSAYQMHGELARLVEVPDVAARIEVSADGLDLEYETSLLRQARRLSQMPTMLVRYYDHPWYGCTISHWSMELQAQVAAQLRDFRISLNELIKVRDRLAEGSKFHPRDCLSALSGFQDFIEVLVESPSPPPAWLRLDTPRADLRDEARSFATQQARHRTLTADLSDSIHRYFFPWMHRVFRQNWKLNGHLPACMIKRVRQQR